MLQQTQVRYAEEREATRQVTVGHLLHSFGRGGMESVLAKVITSLDQGRYRHLVITVSGDFSLADSVPCQNAEFVTLVGRGVPGRVLALLRLARSHGIDVLHARGWSLMLEGALVGKALGIPAVYSFHGKTHNEIASYSARRRWAEACSARLYDRVLTLTPAMQRDLAASLGMPAERIGLIANGTPELPAGPDQRARARARAELGLEADHFVVGFAGRFDPVKDLATLVAGFARFSAQAPEARLVLVGEGPGAAAVRQQVAELGLADRVCLPGFSPRVQQLMQGFDLYLQTSLYEGLSNTIIEALSAGLPVVCTDAGGNADIIEPGRNGLLVGVGDADACARGLEELYRNPELRRAMRDNNLAKHRESYSLRAMTHRYDELYGGSLVRG